MTTQLQNKVAFISGASRGIGRSIAIKLAKSGAKVVVAAKSNVPHPKLPGTIYTVQQEIQQAGGVAHAIKMDLRDEESISSAILETIDTYGKIDILINNASAIYLADTLNTPAKRLDLMMQINYRGTYLCSQKALPYLLKSENGHIVNMSPPLSLKPKWFKHYGAYTIAKYAMSMCVIAMSEEHKGKLAVNALWPKTVIDTAALNMLPQAIDKTACRTPEIMADAVHAIVTKPVSFRTGQFLIDEDVLREEGISQFDDYALTPGKPLLPDFFLD